MKTTITRFFAFLCTISVLTFYALAIDEAPPEEGPGETMARMLKLGEQLATPNENHIFLQKLTGQWTTRSSILNLPPESGTAKNTMILGKRFLDGSYQGSFAGVSFAGRMLLGYDNYKHKFVATFIDSLGTSMRSAEGLLDQSGSVLSLWGTMDEWMTDEHDKPVMYRYRIIDKDHYVLEVHDLSILSGDTLVINVQYERVLEQ